MRRRFTLEVFERRPARMYAILCELSPTLKRHAKVLRQMGEAGLLRELCYAAKGGNRYERLRVMLKARYWLMEYLQFSEEKADYYVMALGAAYDLRVTPPKSLPRPSPAPAPVAAKPVRRRTAAKPPKPTATLLYGGRTGNRWWGNLHWTLDSDGLLSVAGRGDMKNFTYDASTGRTDIPWKNHFREISSVLIESGVTSIGANSFRGCVNLTSVRISYGVTSVGAYAFSGCGSLTSVRVPDSVTVIGENAFHDCTSLRSVQLSNRLTCVGNWTFDGCTRLTSVAIPYGVTAIGDWTFYECRRLTSVRIPDSVSSIGWYAFRKCDRLRQVSVPKGAEIAQDAFDDAAAVTRKG